MSGSGLILVTGGTGTTGRPLVRRLREAGANVRVASRHPSLDGGAEHVYVDWTDPATFPAALADVQRIYVLPPSFRAAPMTVVEPFLVAAQADRARRIVLLSVAGESTATTPTVEQVHRTVERTAVEWAILRPTWFMQNFVQGHPFAAELRARGEITTATGDGRIGFIDVSDVAAVAAHALLDDRAPNTEYRLTGPQTLSYTEVAAIITAVSGRQVSHVALTDEERAASIRALGLPEVVIPAVLEVETKIRNGTEDHLTSTVEELTGRRPRTFREFAMDHRAAWHNGDSG